MGLYQVLDNYDGKLLAIAFTEEMAEHIVSKFPADERVPDDPETIRFVYEDCFQHCTGHADQIGSMLLQLGREIQLGREWSAWNKMMEENGGD